MMTYHSALLGQWIQSHRATHGKEDMHNNSCPLLVLLSLENTTLAADPAPSPTDTPVIPERCDFSQKQTMSQEWSISIELCENVDTHHE